MIALAQTTCFGARSLPNLIDVTSHQAQANRVEAPSTSTQCQAIFAYLNEHFQRKRCLYFNSVWSDRQQITCIITKYASCARVLSVDSVDQIWYRLIQLGARLPGTFTAGSIAEPGNYVLDRLVFSTKRNPPCSIHKKVAVYQSLCLGRYTVVQIKQHYEDLCGRDRNNLESDLSKCQQEEWRTLLRSWV